MNSHQQTPSTADSTPIISQQQKIQEQQVPKSQTHTDNAPKESEPKKQAPKPLNQKQQLERLTTERFQNPFDVLQLTMDATEEEIKKQHRLFSVILHPDRCSDERAKEAFFIVDQAYKTLMDGEKKKVYLRIMNEAKERTIFQRAQENKKRQKQGMSELPQDSFDGLFKDNLKKLFDEIEEKKMHLAKLAQSQIMKKHEEQENKKLIEQYRILTEDEWEKTRDERVGNWRKYVEKKNVIGSKKSDKSIHAPQVKMEERPSSAPKLDPTQQKPIGINEDYKKKWK